MTLISGMGVLVYMAHLGYEHEKEKIAQKKANEDRLNEKIDADIGATEEKNKDDMGSFTSIPSVS